MSHEEVGKSHAERNAESHAETIIELYRGYKALTEDKARRVEVDGEEYTDADVIRERAAESALSVEVRGPWYTLENEPEDQKPVEYRVMLTWGGPALRVVGDLDQYGQADEYPQMQLQDWGIPWTDYEPDNSDADWPDALKWFINCFCFGE